MLTDSELIFECDVFEKDFGGLFWFLRPKDGYRASDLQVREEVFATFSFDDDFTFDKVGHISILIDTSALETSACLRCMAP